MAIQMMDAMDPQTEQALLSDSVQRRLPSRYWLFYEGERTDDAYLVVSGLLKLLKTASNGTEVVLAIRGAGDLVGELSTMDARPRLVSAVTITEASVVSIGRERLTVVMRKRQDLTLALLANLTGQLRSTALQLLAITSGDAMALVSRRLFQLATEPRFGFIRSEPPAGSIVVEMPVSQRELATWSGVSHRSTVGVLEHLRHDGIITTSRLHLEILDLPRLRSRAGPLVATEPR